MHLDTGGKVNPQNPKLQGTSPPLMELSVFEGIMFSQVRVTDLKKKHTFTPKLPPTHLIRGPRVFQQ